MASLFVVSNVDRGIETRSVKFVFAASLLITHHVCCSLFQKPPVSTKLDIYVFYHHHWVDTSADECVFPKGIIRPVSSVLALAWLIRYIFIV